MQHNYQSINKLEVELTQLEEAAVPTRPREFFFAVTTPTLEYFSLG
jgi:hypothetical protein